MPLRIHDMESDLRRLLDLIKRECPTLYSKIYDDDVKDYIDNNEFGLAFELLTYRGVSYIDQLPRNVLGGIGQIIRAYDMHTFSKNQKINERYDRFQRAIYEK